jgi:hypothetical protein
LLENRRVFVSYKREEQNQTMKELVRELSEQYPEKQFWTCDELYELVKNKGFHSKRDVGISLTQLGFGNRVLSRNGIDGRFYWFPQHKTR